MSTFYDPATIRRLAADGDAFYRGAAWILDQQDAARAIPPEDPDGARALAELYAANVRAPRIG